jgi:hypothetical protein
MKGIDATGTVIYNEYSRIVRATLGYQRCHHGHLLKDLSKTKLTKKIK